LAPLHEYETEIHITTEPQKMTPPADSSSSKGKRSKAGLWEGSAIDSDESHSSSGKTLRDPTTPGATITSVDNDATPRPPSRGPPQQSPQIDTDVTPRPPKSQRDSPRTKDHRGLFHWKRH